MFTNTPQPHVSTDLLRPAHTAKTMGEFPGFTSDAYNPLVVTKITKKREMFEGGHLRYRFQVALGGARLLSGTKFGLLEELERRGYGDSPIGVDVPREHTQWASVNAALAWGRARHNGGYIVGVFPTTPLHKEYMMIMAALGGTYVSFWHRPGAMSKRIIKPDNASYGRREFRIVFDDAKRGILAVVVGGNHHDIGSYMSIARKFGISSYPGDKRFVGKGLDFAVETAIDEWKEDPTKRNLDKLETAFSLAYADEVAKELDGLHDVDDGNDRMGFPYGR